MTTDPRAIPLANDNLTVEILKLVKNAQGYKQVRRGANETTKSLNRGLAEFVVLAADAIPLEIILQIPLICEDKNISYVFVPSKNALGRSCGISRPVVACAVIGNDQSPLSKQITTLRDQIEKLLV
ncbi:putative 13 kDa ribonucleoprotein-associated protein [Blattamonas nauphoetae]|uniref:H/ACA ribonucleoprotein complex subunit 2 n=1 Tax=Blattamonas nauphoetae TaxID=2049346 RepID=A0ABQ9YAT4_9EUKA|nr:putative 13 kDa ribonucleoprotein-associated protein [Blattamonas nauphoetae]